MSEEIDLLLSAREFVQHALKVNRLPAKAREDMLTVNAKLEYVIAKLAKGE